LIDNVELITYYNPKQKENSLKNHLSHPYSISARTNERDWFFYIWLRNMLMQKSLRLNLLIFHGWDVFGNLPLTRNVR